jgi:hypothetical protein
MKNIYWAFRGSDEERPEDLTRLLGHNRDNLNTGVTFVQESKKARKQMKNKNRPLLRKVVVPARTATDQRHLQRCAGVAAVTATT